MCVCWVGVGVFVCVSNNNNVKNHMVFRFNLHELTHWTFIFLPWEQINERNYFSVLLSGSVINNFTIIKLRYLLIQIQMVSCLLVCWEFLSKTNTIRKFVSIVRNLSNKA